MSGILEDIGTFWFAIGFDHTPKSIKMSMRDQSTALSLLNAVHDCCVLRMTLLRENPSQTSAQT